MFRARSTFTMLLSVAVAGAAMVAMSAGPAAAATSNLQVVSPISMPYPSAPLAFSGTGDVTAAGRFVDVQIPPAATPNTSTSGCEAADFAGFVPGSIAVIQRARARSR